MEVKNIEIMNVKAALRGMRNPMNSWAKGDSTPCSIGENDLELAHKLIKAGGEHRKFMRQIFVSCDITAPIYWWKEFDTYKVGTVSNSTSTMHKIHSKLIDINDFEMDDFEDVAVFDYKDDTPIGVINYWDEIIFILNNLRTKFVETKDKRYWKELIRLLPESYLQTRTITMSFENLYSIVRQRKGHKLTEWKTFIDAFRNQPYTNDLIFYEYDSIKLPNEGVIKNPQIVDASILMKSTRVNEIYCDNNNDKEVHA